MARSVPDWRLSLDTRRRDDVKASRRDVATAHGTRAGEDDFSLDDDSEDDDFESAPKPAKKAAPKPKAKPAPRAPAKAKAPAPVADSPLPKAKGQKRAARQVEDSPGACVFSPEPARRGV